MSDPAPSRRAKALWTLFAILLVMLLPLVAFWFVQRTGAALVTNDTANIVFTQFQQAIDKGDQIRDPITAAAVANEAYKKQTQGNLLDGWGNPMHIYAVINGNQCELDIQSAGPDGRFGDADDLTMTKVFDVSPASRK